MTDAAGHAPSVAEEVSPLELFFDLVFVFAISQLSQHLLGNLSWRGVAETLVLVAAICTVWFSTSWQAVALGVESARAKLMLLAVLLVGLFMNAAITGSFADAGWAFAATKLLALVGCTVWTWAGTADPVLREHYLRMLLWLAATAPLWLAGAAADPGRRLLWWAAAAGLDLLGAWLAHPVPGRRLVSDHLPFAGGHMAERYRLFLLIALGETVLTTGTAIAAAPLTATTVLTGTAALAGSVALWALGFGRANQLASRHVEATTDPVNASRLAGNVMEVMVAGLVAVAVANEVAIAHPAEHGTPLLAALLFGGPALYLLAEGWYLRTVLQVSPRLLKAGAAVLLVAAVLTLAAPLGVALVVVATVLAALAVADLR